MGEIKARRALAVARAARDANDTPATRAAVDMAEQELGRAILAAAEKAATRKPRAPGKPQDGRKRPRGPR